MECINIVVYSETRDHARGIAQQTVGGTEDHGVFCHTHEGVNLNGFLRWSGGSGFALPIGVTDIIIAHVPAGSVVGQEASAYLQQRAGTPVRIICSSDESLKSLESEGIFYTNNESGLRELALNKYNEYINSLKQIVAKHDNGTGVVVVENYKNFLTELGCQEVDSWVEALKRNPDRKLNHQFVKLIRVVGLDGEYERLLREYFNAEAHFVVHTSKVSDQFHQVMQSFQEQQLHLDYKGNLEIGCTETFTPGLCFGVNFFSGEELMKLMEQAPYSVSHSPISFSLELGIKDPSLFQSLIPVLNMFKDMAKEMVPQVGMAFRLGLDIQFRVCENRFFIDVVFGGLVAYAARKHLDKFLNLKNIKFSSHKGFTFQTEFSPLFLLTYTFEQLVKSACKVSIKGNAEVFNLKVLTSILHKLFDSNIIPIRENKKKAVHVILNAINILKMLGFELKYDANDLYNSIIDSMNGFSPNNVQQLSQRVSESQTMGGAMIEQGKGMTMFVADYIDHIKNSNLDEIKLHFNLTFAKLGFNVFFSLPGLTQFLNEKLLSE